jgi:23S rRNA G2445 N2-methylase RlmL
MSVKQRSIKVKQNVFRCELETTEGLEFVTKDELLTLCGGSVSRIDVGDSYVQFDFQGNLKQLLKLKTAVAAYLLLPYDVPRPKALLGHEHFTRLIDTVKLIQTLGDSYNSLHISAAGSDSSVMNRIKQQLAEQSGLEIDESGGDLFIRIRRAKIGWEVLLRISKRPLATRSWRVRDMEGALNAPLAHAIMRLTRPSMTDGILNLVCGSATLMIERLELMPAKRLIGCDNSPYALGIARANLNAAKQMANIDLLQADVLALPFGSNCFNILCADLPFGQLVGSHEENISLYPALLKEAARVGKIGAVFTVITHEVRLMEQLLQDNSCWHVENVIKVSLRGLHPRIYQLRKQ